MAKRGKTRDVDAKSLKVSRLSYVTAECYEAREVVNQTDVTGNYYDLKSLNALTAYTYTKTACCS